MSELDSRLYQRLSELAGSDVYDFRYEKEYGDDVLYHQPTDITIKLRGYSHISANSSEFWSNWLDFGFWKNLKLVRKFRKLIAQYEAIANAQAENALLKEKIEK